MGNYWKYKSCQKFVPERYLTTQHERDRETGLDYRGARYYDSDIGRFLSIDPWTNKYPAWSTYNYVMGNPIILIDPTGKGPGDPPKKVHYYNVNVDKNGEKQVSYSRSSHKGRLKGGGYIPNPTNKKGEKYAREVEWQPTTTTDIYSYWDEDGDLMYEEIKKGEEQAPVEKDDQIKNKYQPDDYESGESAWYEEGASDPANRGTFSDTDKVITAFIIAVPVSIIDFVFMPFLGPGPGPVQGMPAATQTAL